MTGSVTWASSPLLELKGLRRAFYGLDVRVESILPWRRAASPG